VVSAADLALAYISQGKFAESEPLAREAMQVDQKNRSDDWQRFRAETLLGASLAGQKKYAEAEPLLLEGYQGMEARKDRIAVPDRSTWSWPIDGSSSLPGLGQASQSSPGEEEVGAKELASR
jgi:Tetratricopeptide repeat